MTPTTTPTFTPPRADSPTLLAGRYRLGERIGVGSSATVYEAMDTRFERPVTIKLFEAVVASEPGLRARFHQQVAKAARLQHPNVIAILDAGFAETDDGASRPFVVTEPAGTQSLRAFVRQRGRLSPKRAVKLARQVAAALSYAHGQGVVHADVKPENVIVDERGDRALLADFSLSFVSTRTGSVTRETIARRAAYLAPEQVCAEAITPATDVYGLGVMLYELIVGRPPFVGSTPEATARRRVDEHALPAGMFDPSIPRALDAILARALEREPEARYRSVESLDAALARLDPAELQPREARLPETDDLARRRQRIPAIWGALGPIVPLAGAVVAVALGISLLRPMLQNLPNAPRSGAPTTVPGVVGKHVVEAQLLAEKSGLVFQVAEERMSDRVPRDIVVQQEPTPGYKTDSGQTVRVIVSAGVIIPDVRGKSLENAEASLKQLNWKIARVERGPYPGTPAGTIVMQHPAPGDPIDAPGELALAVAQ